MTDKPEPSQIQTCLAAATIPLFGMILLLSLFFPVYIDEIFMPVFNSRAGFDGWKTIHPCPQCGASFITDIPFALMPGRTLSWLVEAMTDGFYAMRLTCIGVMVTWIAYTTWFVKRCIVPEAPVLYIIAGIISFAALGTLPYPLLLDRPEPRILLAAIIFASLPTLVVRYPSLLRWQMVALGVIFALLTSWLISSHPKALFYSPLVFVSAFSTRKWNKTLSTVLICSALLVCFQSLHYWGWKYACPGSPQQQRQWDGAALNPSLFFTSPALFWWSAINDFISSLIYIARIIFHNNDYWLPPTPDGITGEVPCNLAIIAVIAATVQYVYRGLKTALRNARALRIFHPELAATLCLFIAFVGQCAQQRDKSFYNASLVWMTLVLCGLMTGHYLRAHSTFWQDKIEVLNLNFRRLCVVAVMSQGVLLLNYIPATVIQYEKATPGGIIKTNSNWATISPLHYEQRRHIVLEAAQSCHIPTDGSARRLVVDMTSYFVFKRTYQPFTAFIPVFRELGASARTFLALLKKWQSSGLVVECSRLPKELRILATEREGFCCLSKEQIDDSETMKP